MKIGLKNKDNIKIRKRQIAYIFWKTIFWFFLYYFILKSHMDTHKFDSIFFLYHLISSHVTLLESSKIPTDLLTWIINKIEYLYS